MTRKQQQSCYQRLHFAFIVYRHLKPPQAISHSMTITTRIPPPTISFIWRFCSHILLRSCLPCLWKLSAWIQSTDSQQANGSEMHQNPCQDCQTEPQISCTWNCKFSVLSTKSSILSPRSKTCIRQVQRFDCWVSFIVQFKFQVKV